MFEVVSNRHELINEITEQADFKNPDDIVLIDFSKAFDSISNKKNLYLSLVNTPL